MGFHKHCLLPSHLLLPSFERRLPFPFARQWPFLPELIEKISGFLHEIPEGAVGDTGKGGAERESVLSAGYLPLISPKLGEKELFPGELGWESWAESEDRPSPATTHRFPHLEVSLSALCDFWELCRPSKSDGLGRRKGRVNSSW